MHDRDWPATPEREVLEGGVEADEADGDRSTVAEHMSALWQMIVETSEAVSEAERADRLSRCLARALGIYLGIKDSPEGEPFWQVPAGALDEAEMALAHIVGLFAGVGVLDDGLAILEE